MTELALRVINPLMTGVPEVALATKAPPYSEIGFVNVAFPISRVPLALIVTVPVPELIGAPTLRVPY